MTENHNSPAVSYLTLREYAAVQAMQGLITAHSGRDYHQIVREAVLHADALMAALAGDPPTEMPNRRPPLAPRPEKPMRKSA